MLRVDDFDNFFVAALHGREEILFRDFSGAAFHHEEAFARTGIDEIQVALLALFLRRVDHECAVDAAHAYATDRTHEGHFGDVERGRGGVDCEGVGFVNTIC